MEFTKTYSSSVQGIKVLIFALIAAVIFYGAFYKVISSEGPIQGIKGDHGIFIQIVIIVFSIAWLTFVTYAIRLLIKNAILQIHSKINWEVSLKNNILNHKSPHKEIGETFSISLNEIEAVKRKKTITYNDGKVVSTKWLILCKDGSEINIGQNSPFDIEDIFTNIKTENRNIQYIEETIRDDI